MALYMKYGSIKGSVTTDGFKDWIELRSFQWGVSRAIGSAARSMHGREHSEPSLSEVTLTKLTDAATPKLFLDAVAGQLNNDVTIKFTTTIKAKVETFLTYKLENTGLSHYSLSSGGDNADGVAGAELHQDHRDLYGHGPGPRRWARVGRLRFDPDEVVLSGLPSEGSPRGAGRSRPVKIGGCCQTRAGQRCGSHRRSIFQR